MKDPYCRIHATYTDSHKIIHVKQIIALVGERCITSRVLLVGMGNKAKEFTFSCSCLQGLGRGKRVLQRWQQFFDVEGEEMVENYYF